MIIKLSPAAKRAVSNAGWLMTDRIVRLGFGLIVGVKLARYLGPVQFGGLNFAISFIALLVPITTLGLENIVIKNIIHEPQKNDEVMGSALVLRLMSSFLTCLLIFVIALLTAGQEKSLLVAILSLTLVFQSLDIVDCYFQAQMQSKFAVIARVSAFLIGTSIRLLFIFLRAPVWWFALSYSIEAAFTAAGLAVAFRSSGGRFLKWRARAIQAVELLKQSWPVLFSAMAIMVYMRIDVVMLEALKGDRAVGIYATATKISEIWYFIAMAIVSSVSPAIIRSFDQPETFNLNIQRLFSLMSLISVVIGSFIALAAPLIIRLLYTDEFAAAAPVLAVHVWASVFVFLGVAQSPWDISQNLLKLTFYRSLTGAAANILLNFILIPKYSAMGAAWATLTSYGLSTMVGNAFNARTRIVFYMQLRSLYLSKLWSVGPR
jgi:polysaccharide transporter, PST family